MPQLVGLTAAGARDLLDEQEFPSPSIEDRLVTRADQGGVVLSQEPPAGTNVFRDASITIVVGDDPFAR